MSVTGDDEPLLLTPGPLTTSATVKRAMLRDWGSRDRAFIEMTARVRRRLVAIAGGAADHACVLLQGSGTYAVEATLGTLVPHAGKVLVLANGAYGRRMVRIAEVIGRAHAVLETAEDSPPDARAVDRVVAQDPAITHVAAVHCETTSGILNPVAEIAEVVATRGRRLLVDAMSSFGALPLDIVRLYADAVIASANKCLEGVPGVAFVIARKQALEAAGEAPSLALDLADQWRFMERTGQWRFTPPTHVLAALDQALAEHEAEGGVGGRGARYRETCRALVGGMRGLGFETFLPDSLQAPIIVTFHSPADPNYDFERFYGGLRRRGFAIYPGKLTTLDTFRIGCMGRLGVKEIEAAVAAVAEVAKEMGVANRGRAQAAPPAAPPEPECALRPAGR
ncbi:MAG: 2-aminoethylphosphonate--pyruvate transaminase [Alphaproteobacteria bacterium]